MDVKEIRKLLEGLAATDVREFTYDTGDYKLSVKRGEDRGPATVTFTPPQAAQQGASSGNQQAAQSGQQAPPQAPPAAAAPQSTAPEAAGPQLLEVLAPIVGTFYGSPSPEAPPFVKVGDRVSAGTVLCIIEAMKLMNEIEAETAGIVREVSVGNGDPVEYGQVLFRIEPA
ncbi:MAG TPA: acetyl-CoA carboxylase biotin carboxyl carrier protein [Trueperaceae bacterium]|nr:acetyl-CoA carboxylase biotin carboxyl carrier protein [Trueperaceae bacterium]HRQ11166.1 acetyl-CoA carboxylase biotin carboxyl carrier protein [Trueperaceae bacterium]